MTSHFSSTHQVTVPGHTGINTGRNFIAAIQSTSTLLPILTLSVAAAIWLRILKDAASRIIASVIQSAIIAIVTSLEVVMALASRGIARVDGACHTVVTVHWGHVNDAGASGCVTDVLAVALVAVLARLGGVNAHTTQVGAIVVVRFAFINRALVV